MQQFDKYRNLKGKKDSMYVYVLFNCGKEVLLEHIDTQQKSIQRIGDSYKRQLFSGRYYRLKTYTEEQTDGYVFNCVVFIDDDINIHDLSKAWTKNMNYYDVSPINYRYNDYFDLKFLEDLLENDDPYHVFRLNSNRVDYAQITKTKRKAVSSNESKTLDLTSFISDHLPKGKKCIVHGVSSKLKGFVDERAYEIFKHQLKDSEIMEMADRIDQEDVLQAFDDDLQMMHDDKQMHKVVFKKDIPKKIKYGMLQKLYIDSKIHTKFLQNMKKQDLDISFEVVPIDMSIKSFIEDRERKIMQFDGVVGITFY